MRGDLTGGVCSLLSAVHVSLSFLPSLLPSIVGNSEVLFHNVVPSQCRIHRCFSSNVSLVESAIAHVCISQCMFIDLPDVPSFLCNVVEDKSCLNHLANSAQICHSHHAVFEHPEPAKKYSRISFVVVGANCCSRSLGSF